MAKYTVTKDAQTGKIFVRDEEQGGKEKEFESAEALVEWALGQLDPENNWVVIQMDLKQNYYNDDDTGAAMLAVKDRSCTLTLEAKQKTVFS